MKKQFLWPVLPLLLALLLAGCTQQAATQEETAQEEAAPAQEQTPAAEAGEDEEPSGEAEITLENIVAANSHSTWSEKYETVLSCYYDYPDTDTPDQKVWQEGEFVFGDYSDSEGGIFYMMFPLKNAGVYYAAHIGPEGEEAGYTSWLECRQSYEVTFLDPELPSRAEITQVSSDNGKLYVTISEDIEEGEKLIEFVLNSETLFLEEGTRFLVKEDGSREFVFRYTGETDCSIDSALTEKEREMYQILRERMNDAAAHTFTLIMDPGRENETRLETKVTGSDTLSLMLPTQGMTLYTDEACTVPYGEGSEREGYILDLTLTEDLTLYTDAQELMKHLVEANALPALREKYDRLEYVRTSYDSDGSSTETVTWLDEDRYVLSDDAGVLLDDSGEVYELSGGNIRQYLFVGGTYEEFVETYEGIVSYTDQETVQDIYYEGAEIIVETVSRDAYYAEMYVASGMLEEAVEELFFSYTLDAGTLELYSLETWYLDEQGKAQTVWSMERNEECEEYVPDAALTEALASPEKRTVTVIADPGTDKEAVFEKEIPAAFGLRLALPDHFDPTVYQDADCKTEADYTQPGGDATYYVKSR